MNIDEWHPIYQEIAKIIGTDSTVKLYETFKGVQITFPKRLLNKESEANQIYSEYKQGQKINKLAIEHGYSERSIRRILSKYKE